MPVAAQTQFDLHVGFHALINLRLLVGLDHDQSLFIKMAVVRACDHRRAVVRRQLTGQYSGAGHNNISVSADFYRSAAFRAALSISSAHIISASVLPVKAKVPLRVRLPCSAAQKRGQTR